MQLPMYCLWWLSNFDGFLVHQAGSVVLTAVTLIVLACLIVQRRAKKQIWMTTACDVGVLVFAVVQIVSTYCGIYHENSLIYGVGVANAANIYFIFRYGSGLNCTLFRTCAIGACVLGVSLALVNIPASIERFMEWRRLELSDVISFRANFFLVGGGTKTDALSLALALLSFSLIVLACERSRLYRAVAMSSFIGSSAVIVMGMSRGVYLGAISFCAVILVIARICRIKLKSEAQNFLLATGFVMLATISLYAVSVKHIGNSGVDAVASETRSVDGRLHVWSGTLSHIQNYKLFGVGGGNGALYTLKHIEAAAYEPFTARTYNCILEVLLQNGVTGLIAFCAIVVGTLALGWRTIRSLNCDPQTRQAAIFALGGMIAILVSDLTYSSIIRHPPVMCLFFALAGAINGERPAYPPGQPVNRLRTTAFFGIVTLVWLTGVYFAVFGIRRMYSQSEYETASTAMRQGDYENALQHLATAENHSDCDALYASMEGLVHERSADEGQAFDELWKGGVSPLRRREDIQKAVNSYQRASICAPMDSAIHNDLGWLYAMLGEEELAREQIGEAVRLEPNTALYHLSSGLLYERDGNQNAAYEEYAETIARSPRILDSVFFAQLRIRHLDDLPRILDRGKNAIEQFADTPMRRASLAKISFQEDDHETAKSALRNVLIKLPNLSNTWVTLGRIDEHEGDMSGAVLDYRRALFTDPTNRAALANLANDDQVVGEDQEGLQEAQMAVLVEEPSEHAMRSSRMYYMNPLSPDDLVPFGLLAYTEPKVDIDRLCRITYEMAGRRGVDVPSGVIEKIEKLGGKC